jgi:hypothetical protein
MWIVRLALRRPYTFVVAALLLLLLTPFILLRTPTDIFPSIDIPVVSIVWNYTGLNAVEMENRIVYNEERALTTTVNNIEHIESSSYNGIGVIKVFFRQGTSVDAGVAQVTAISQTVLRALPPGTTPPLIIQYNASTVPILQYGVSSPAFSEQEVFDTSVNQIRPGLITVQGAAIPWPYGGKQRLVSVDLDLKALQSQNLSPQDVVNAMSAQNFVLPSGTAKIGPTEYDINLNTSPKLLDELNNLPIKTVNGAVIHVSDVAQVRDGYLPQQNIVRQDGVRSVLISILKTGTASTLSVANGVKQAMAAVEDCLRQAGGEAIHRPVDLCALRHLRRGARRSDCGVPHRDHDSVVPRFVAGHRYHRPVDPTFDPGIVGVPERAGRDHQSDDAGWAGAGRRYSGGRCHRRIGKRSPPDGAGQAGDPGDPRRRPGDCAARRSSPRCASASCSCPCSF